MLQDLLACLLNIVLQAQCGEPNVLLQIQQSQDAAYIAMTRAETVLYLAYNGSTCLATMSLLCPCRFGSLGMWHMWQ